MERLHKAAVEGDADSLLGLLEHDPLILERCSVWSYIETPLHIAALLGHERFVDVILDRKPELAGELDSQEMSPLHLATAKGHLGVVRKLLTVNAGMCSARDVYGRSPLHIAVVKGRVDVLKELVRESPHSARQMMGNGETILHLCVKHYKSEALEVLVELVGDHEFVNLKNDDGDTVLHLAAASKQTEAVSFLTSCTAVEANSRNADGLTAHELLARSGKSGRTEIARALSRSGIGGSPEIGRALSGSGIGGSPEIARALTGGGMAPMTMGAVPPDANDQNIASPAQGKGSKKNRNWVERRKSTLMVVAILIAAMAFQVGVQPPGGFWQDTIPGDNSTKLHTAGHAVMADDDEIYYSSFWWTNTVAFLASMSIILVLVSGLPLRRTSLMSIPTVIMWIAVISLMLTYAHALRIFTPSHQMYMLTTIDFGMIVWLGVMVPFLLVLGHTVRLTLKWIPKVGKSVTWGKSSASVVIDQGRV